MASTDIYGEGFKKKERSLGLYASAAASPHDEYGNRLPAFTIGFGSNKNKGGGSVGKTNNNNTSRRRMSYSRVYDRKKNNNNTYKDNRDDDDLVPPPSALRRRASDGGGNTNKCTGALIHETVAVDYVSPADSGEGELYLYTRGGFQNVEKPKDQPLLIKPDTVNYVSSMKDGEEGKELWEKLCGESKLMIWFDPTTWQVEEIIGLDESKDEWARGMEPPTRRRGSWGGNVNIKQMMREKERDRERERRTATRDRSNSCSSSNRGGGGGGSSTRVKRSPDNTRTRDKPRSGRKGRPDNRGKRGSGGVTPIREREAAVTPVTPVTPTVVAAAAEVPTADDKADMTNDRMVRLEQANVLLMKQLEETQSIVSKLLAEKTNTAISGSSSEATAAVDPSPSG